MTTELNEGEAVYWVNSLKAECVGVGPMHCLQVQKGETFEPDGWTLFYAPIEGFDYEAGYLYRLVVKEESIPAEQVPADASSIRYTLVRILDKEPDTKLRLNDLWVLESMGGIALALDDERQRPRMELDLAKMSVMGFDGCNNFRGAIERLDSSEIVFGPIAGTRKACVDMRISGQFNQSLNQVRGYTLKGTKLFLLDEAGGELLGFQKTD
ncbi:DUF4377 domain-containing protein [Marinobacter salinisoli]|uniref:DUF4377 domain-containing protein n=1 Tax=Marinobacter salinisoli TaxID=2769486 RepID=A0ABX7MUM9_9GAMM|nr:DUF4377 domain-containing protein [Marinobacter salinisoli]QSP93963.1 DUF4377 domain-containing protein [Marinobacter salinisoli]